MPSWADALISKFLPNAGRFNRAETTSAAARAFWLYPQFLQISRLHARAQGTQRAREGKEKGKRKKEKRRRVRERRWTIDDGRR
jgi:hypothetical protein